MKRKNINVNILVSSRKAEKQLGWKPTFTLNRGLKKTIQWYKNEIN
jgi:nucleoside-diphosphate-sugar epimerase